MGESVDVQVKYKHYGILHQDSLYTRHSEVVTSKQCRTRKGTSTKAHANNPNTVPPLITHPMHRDRSNRRVLGTSFSACP